MKNQVVKTSVNWSIPVNNYLRSVEGVIEVEGSNLYLKVCAVGVEGILCESIEPFDIEDLYSAILSSLRKGNIGGKT